jgi:hypothetical protein
MSSKNDDTLGQIWRSPAIGVPQSSKNRQLMAIVVLKHIETYGFGEPLVKMFKKPPSVQITIRRRIEI